MENLIRHYLEEAVTRGESWESEADPKNLISAEALLAYFDTQLVGRVATLQDENYSLRMELMSEHGEA